MKNNIMGKIYIFAIGGTGANVMRSILMLMASGAFPQKEIIPILIDLDENNGNKNQTLSLLSSYSQIQNECHGLINNQSGVFNSKLVYINNGWEIAECSTLLYRKKYIDILEYNELIFDRYKYKKLTDSLFGYNEERYDTIHSFFPKVDAQLARVAFDYSLSGNSIFEKIEMSANPNDMIIIIGSTFGATGKAGICEVLNEFKNRQLLQHLYKAVVLVEPYFEVDKHKYGEPFYYSSTNFIDYYHRIYSNSVNQTFQIKTQKSQYYPYHAGGVEQINPAHSATFRAALTVMSIVDNDGRENEIDFDNSEDCSIDVLYRYGLGDIAMNLSYFAVSCYIWQKMNQDFLHREVYNSLKLYDKLKNNTYVAFDRFVNEYNTWCNEMSKSNIHLFDFNATSLNELIIGKKYIPHGLISLFRGNLLKIYKDEMYRSFREFYTDTHVSNYPAEEMFFKIINSASMRVANEIINS